MLDLVSVCNVVRHHFLLLRRVVSCICIGLTCSLRVSVRLGDLLGILPRRCPLRPVEGDIHPNKHDVDVADTNGSNL